MSSPSNHAPAGVVHASTLHAFGVVGTNSRNNVDPFEAGPGASVWEDWKNTTEHERAVVDVAGMRVRGMVDPTAPGGLPPGWTALGEGFRARKDHMFHLVRAQPAGDFPGCWAVVNHMTEMAYTVLERDVAHLNDLVEPGAAAVARASTLNAQDRRRYEQWMLSTVAALYDATDPDEAAERTLLALAGRVRAEPRLPSA
jgi:hypothetical protein